MLRISLGISRDYTLTVKHKQLVYVSSTRQVLCEFFATQPVEVPTVKIFFDDSNKHNLLAGPSKQLTLRYFLGQKNPTKLYF
jgi:hypothetical protein